MAKIKSIKAREVLDSRANPTVEVEMASEDFKVSAIVASGKSRGKREAVELRDGGKRYGGLGVQKAVKNVNEIIAQKLIGADPLNQKEIDGVLVELAGGGKKEKLGVNAVMGVSMATVKLAAVHKNLPVWRHVQDIAGLPKAGLPLLFMNLINGGLHAGSGLPFQEYIIVPQLDGIAKSLQAGAEIYYELDKVLQKTSESKYVAGAVGDEGGYVPRFEDIDKPFEALEEAIKKAGYDLKIKLAIDAAASVFFRNDMYHMGDRSLTRDDLLAVYKKIIGNHPLMMSAEDPFDENDAEGFANMTAQMGDKLWVVADDLTATNPLRIQEIIGVQAANALIVKPNQVGTITETLDAIKVVRNAGWKIIVAHRSGDTEDPFIADFAVGVGADAVKFGAPARGERTAKYNQLLRIEEEFQG